MRIPISIILVDLYSATGIHSHEEIDIILSESYRIEEKNHYGTILRENFLRENPISYSGLNKEYLSRRYQNRHSINHPTKIPFNGLQRKINQELKREIKQRKTENEKKIKEAFARKIKNKTYHKRHHSRNSNTY